jgi:DNA cross-link repair 1A protein
MAKLLDCARCEVKFKTDKDLKIHEKSCMVSNLISCPLCGMNDLEVSNMNEHVNDQKENKDPNELFEQISKPVQTILPTQIVNTVNILAPAVQLKRKRTINEIIKPKEVQKVPFYKFLPTTPFTVDAFSFGKIDGCLGYFLSHFHSDHYTKLNSKFKHGPIYCSSITASLIRTQLKVQDIYIKELELDKKHKIDGIFVTLINANHCPGAVIFHFEIPAQKTKYYLHTGDFRASDIHWDHELLRKPNKFDLVYLDTTYLDKKHTFPKQQEIIDLVTEISKRITKESIIDILSKNSIKNFFKIVKPTQRVENTLLVVGTYLIGKEKVFKTAALSMDSRIYANERKTNILKQLQDKELNEMLTNDPQHANVHVVSMDKLKKESLENLLISYPKFTKIVALKPTGWSFKGIQKFSKSSLNVANLNSNIAVVSIPYSEHSSFGELKEFVQKLDIVKIIPTVNVYNHKVYDALFKSWKD